MTTQQKHPFVINTTNQPVYDSYISRKESLHGVLETLLSAASSKGYEIDSHAIERIMEGALILLEELHQAVEVMQESLPATTHNPKATDSACDDNIIPMQCSVSRQSLEVTTSHLDYINRQLEALKAIDRKAGRVKDMYYMMIPTLCDSLNRSPELEAAMTEIYSQLYPSIFKKLREKEKQAESQNAIAA